MPRYLNTRGKASIAIGICDRCSTKVPYSDLRADGNTPGLRVCLSNGCWDRRDPWRLPARQPENISLRHPRPDARIGQLVVFLGDELGSYLGTEDGVPLIISEEEGL